MPTSKPCFRVKLTPERRELLNAPHLKTEMDRIALDGRVRVSADSFEFDYPYDDFRKIYSLVRQTLDTTNREGWHLTYATEEYKKEMADALDNARDHYRDFGYPDQEDPGLDDDQDSREGTKKLLKDGPGMVIANEHTDQHTKDLMVQAMDDQDIGLLFIEEFQVGLQPFIDEYLDSPNDVFPPALQQEINTYLTTWEVDFAPLLRKAKQKGARVYGIDSAEAHYVTANDPRHHESRCAVMNQVSEKVMKEAIKKYPNKKFVAMCGSAHATTHEGGIPGLSEIMGVPSVTMSPDGKMKQDKENPKNREMPPKLVQHFADKFSDQVMKEYDKVKSTTPKDESIDMIELKVQATKLAEKLFEGGHLKVEKDIAKQLSSKDAKKVQQELLARTKQRRLVREELKGLIDKKDHDALAKRLDKFKTEDPYGFGNDYEMTGTTMLHYAAEKGSAECINKLIDSGSKLEIYDSGPGNPGMTPLHRAAMNGNGDAIEALLKRGADVNVPTKKSPKQTAMHMAATANGDGVSKLIAGGGDANVKDSEGKTPLHFAGESGKTTACQNLIDAGVADDKTPEGQRVRAVMQRKHFKTAKDALKKPEEFEKTICDLEQTRAKAKSNGTLTEKDEKEFTKQIKEAKLALEKAREDAVKVLEETIKDHPEVLWDQDPEGQMSLLHFAAATGNAKAIEKILAKDKSLIDVKNESGNTAAHLAVRRRPYLDDALRNDLLTAQDNVMDALLKGGAKVNEQNKDGQTPLHLAALTGNSLSAQRLIRGGANTDLKDNRDWTAYDVCLASTKSGVEQVFYQEGKESRSFKSKKDNPSVVDILVQCTLSEEKGQESAIRERYEQMYADENLRPILELAAVDAQQDRDPPKEGGVRIVMSKKDSIGLLYAAPDWYPGGGGGFDDQANTFVLGKQTKNTDMNGLLIHEMTHMATRKMYGTGTVPYGDPVEEKAYRDAIANDVKNIHLLNDGDPLEARIKNRMSSRMNDYVHRGGDEQLLQEFVVGVPQLIAEFGAEAIQKHCPNMMKFFKDFTTKCQNKVKNDPTLQNFHAVIDNTELDEKLQKTPPKLPNGETGEWMKKDAPDLTVDGLMQKIEAEYISRHGEMQPLKGTTVPFESGSFKLKKQDEVDFKLKMSRVRTALLDKLKTDQMASEINPDAIRSLVTETVGIVDRAKNVDDIDGMVSGNVSNWTRDSKIRLVDHKLEQGKTMDPQELAEATILLAENRALGKLGNGDPNAVVDVDPGKHKALVKSLSEDLAKKMPNLSPEKLKKLMPQLATAIVDNPKSPFSLKKKKGTDPQQVNVDKSKAKRLWLQKLKAI